MEPRLDALVAEWSRLASAAGVSAPPVEATDRGAQFAFVDLRRGGTKLVVHRALLGAPAPVVRGVLAHEIAHVVHRDPATRRRLRLGSVAAIWMIVLADIAISFVLISVAPRWLAALALVPELAALLLPRTLHLAVQWRQEYRADRYATKLLGGAEEVFAFLDWTTAHSRPLGRPLPVELWNLTHPSGTARRRALMGAYARQMR